MDILEKVCLHVHILVRLAMCLEKTLGENCLAIVVIVMVTTRMRSCPCATFAIVCDQCNCKSALNVRLGTTSVSICDHHKLLGLWPPYDFCDCL